jgi:lysylphosphatidylglycerol synthetase-like protein (DUF2156 family)
VAIGGRVIVVGDLALGGSAGGAAAVIEAIDSWIGGGVLIFNHVPPEPALRRAVVSFAAEPGRRVLYLRDPGRDAAAEGTPAPEVTSAVVLDLETGAGSRRVRVEPGEQIGRQPALARARDLVAAGTTGLITSRAGHLELIRLEEGFYANAGSTTHGQVAWVELEAGNDLHVRLLHDRRPSRTATWIKRCAARLRPRSAGGQEPVGDHEPAAVEATLHQGASWPPATDNAVRLRRVRRLSASLVAFAAILSMLSAFSEPFRDRLHRLLSVVPLAIPQAANTVVAIAGLSLLLLARAIRRGQHRAWLICEGLLVTTALLHVLKGVDLEEALVAGGVAVFLFVHRSAFRAGVDRPSTRRGLRTLFVGAALAVVCGTAGVELGTRVSGARHHQRLPLPSAIVASLERMVGLKTIVLPDRLDDFFTPAMAAVAVGVALAAAWLLLRPVVARHGGSAEPDRSAGLTRARDVVRQSGSGTLDYFALRTDKQFFFRRHSMVAYGVYGSVCLVSPDPIGPASERQETWQTFHRFADSKGWNLGVLGAAEDWLPVYRASGLHELYVGDEAVVNCRRFTLEGGRNKGLRQAVNRVAKYGYTISFHDPSRITPSLRESLELVMTKSRRGDVERGFSMTLGRAFDPHDDGLLLAIVHGPNDAGPVAFCQYVPAPGIDGYSLDLMRRDDGEHPNGLMDFAIVETIRWLCAHDWQGLGLNFATMRAVLAGESGDGFSQRIQAWLLRRMSDTMQIESLWKFTAKYDPDWQPRYAVYDAPENVLPVAFAVARAESFWELPVIGRFLVPAGTSPAAGSPDRDLEHRGDEDGSLQPTGHQ